MSAARLDQEYIYKTDLKFGGKIKNLSAKTFRLVDPLSSTNVDTNTTNVTTPQL